jgi:hypothetical protein
VLVWCLRPQKQPRALTIHLAFIPLYAVLWGAYLASNLIWFHMLMPISGLLKSENGHDHMLGHNLPHTALLSLAICVLSLLVLWRMQRDRWFFFAELPFFIGILFHAAYITLRMTSETRWTWYYVSWALLAALTASRAAACVFRAATATTALRTAATALAILFSILLFYKMGWKHSREQVAENTRVPAMRQTLEADGLHRLIAYDQPGGMAYFTKIAVVPLDGLMADREFQTELSQRGIADFLRKEKIDGFAGPPVPLDKDGERTYCGQLFLESTRYTCEPWAPGPYGEPQWMITGVEVYSRLPLAPAGYIPLPPSDILWTANNYVTVWKIPAEKSARTVAALHSGEKVLATTAFSPNLISWKPCWKE